MTPISSDAAPRSSSFGSRTFGSRTKSRTSLLASPLANLLIGALTLSACAGSQSRDDRALYRMSEGPAAEAMGSWMAGDDEAARAATTPLDLSQASADALFAAAEIAFWSGDVERAYDAHAELLRRFPSHMVARYAAARIYTLRDEVMDYEVRTEPLLEGLDYAELAPLTRLYASMAAQTVAYRLWDRSEASAPFDAARFGFAAAWTATPMLSPWRLLDLDTPMPPEDQPRLAERYLSPLVATDEAANQEASTPYLSGGISLHAGFETSGVYYLETFATLPQEAGTRDYWLYGNFVGAARVWIDGELVMGRDEGDYGTGKRLRRVRLSPGTHRVLVKLAFESGYRDWFDLSFIPDGATPVDEAGLSFRYACREDRTLPDCFEGSSATATGADIELPGEAFSPDALDPAQIGEERLETASDEALYLAMLSAYFNGDSSGFAAAWEALSARRPEFAPGHALYGQQVQTMWELPSRRRDALALQALRRARRLDPDSGRYLSDLGAWLRDRDGEREAGEILASAREQAFAPDGRVRAIAPLNGWASWLESKGWDAEAEQAWEAALQADPANCQAATKLQSLYAARLSYPAPEAITPAAERCADLREVWLSAQPDRGEELVALRARQAARYPLRSAPAQSYAKALRLHGDDDEVEAVLKSALERMPDSDTLWSELADLALARQGTQAAVAVLDQAIARNGRTGWLVWRRALLADEIPLQDLMHDGRKAAAEAVSRSTKIEADGEGQLRTSLSNDDAYYVVDFAAREYFPDGASVTLTHTVVRVMTKNAIDRYAEQSVPGDARLLVARTIKQAGSTRVPEDTAGKTALSMPGLAEGDFVEIAYLQYDEPKLPTSHVEGMRFFFQMADISTLHSEYVVIGDTVSAAAAAAAAAAAERVMLVNDPPTPQPFTFEGRPALRFLARDNPRPRDEAHSAPIDEFLPWVQVYRDGYAIGDFEADRRDVAEQIHDSMKLSPAAAAQIRAWLDAAPRQSEAEDRDERPDRAFAEQLFYEVAAFLPDPTPSAFGTELSHAVATRQGNALLLLKAAYDAAGVPAEIFLVKSKYQSPTPREVGEFNRYLEPLLRVRVPGSDEEIWSEATGPEAMFGALSNAVAGQPAVCVSCAEPEAVSVPTHGHRDDSQALTLRGEVAADGTLTGEMTYLFDGVSAASVRRGLRGRTDETSRMKLMDALINGVISASTVKDWRIEGEDAPAEPLRVIVDFSRPDFARSTGPGMRQIEAALFREPIASLYASLAERTTPILVSNDRDNRYRLELDLSAFEEARLGSESGERVLPSTFGDYARTTRLVDGKLTIDAHLNMPIQRVPVSAYRPFQRWATGVEQSATLFVVLRE